MRTLEIGRVADRGAEVSELLQSQYGKLTAPDTLTSLADGTSRVPLWEALASRGSLKRITPALLCVKLDQSTLDVLTARPDAVGCTFGIMTAQKVVHSAFISSNTIPGELHLARLNGGGVPLADFKGIDQLDKMMVSIGDMLRMPGVGTAAADTAAGAASEVGHTMQAISALTDHELLGGMQNGGGHFVHDWAEQGSIGVNLTERSNGRSAFTVETDSAVVNGGFLPDIIIDRPTPNMVLVDHVSMRDERQTGPEVPPAQLAIGLGMLAAETQLGVSGQSLNDYLMRTAQIL